MTPARMDPMRLRRARAYRAFTLWLGIASTLTGAAAMLGLYLGGAGAAVRDAVRGYPLLLDVYLVIVVFGIAGWLVQGPFAYASWSRGRREGLIVQSLAGASVDHLKGLGLTLVLIGIPTALWYWVLDRPDWWVATIVGTAILTALGTLLGPALTSLFFRFEPLADAAVAERVRTVAERAGVRVSGVYRWGLGAKTTAANAAVIGVGPTKRIALGDTLLAAFPIDETEAVVAHEVGHDVSGDPPRYVVAFTIAGSAALILVRAVVDAASGGRAADPATYPLLAAALALLAFVGRPALMAFTRWRESAADTFGARHTSADAMARALVRLADQNLADPEPPRWEELWSFSHPAIATRVRQLGLDWEQYAN